MDPISAAGIGLSVASLCLQVFAGCIKGYEVFADAVDMPVKYATLRTRLRIEQSRLLNWGEQIGLLEDLLDNHSHMLGLHHNLIMDVLLEQHEAFRSCLKITAKYDMLFASLDTPQTGFSSKQTRFLHRVRQAWQTTSHAGARLQWAMVRQDTFASLITRLGSFNDRIESFLDRSTIRELHDMQERSNLLLLQLTQQVSQLQILAEGFQVTAHSPVPTLSRSSTLVVDEESRGAAHICQLAAFKAQHVSVESSQETPNMIIDSGSLAMSENVAAAGRVQATSGGKTIMIEWRTVLHTDRPIDETYQKVIETRLSKLAWLLNLPKKLGAFRTLHCLGYCRIETEDELRYGLVYEVLANANGPSTPIPTLRAYLAQISTPSLSARITLAHQITESIMYLHAVDWLHKGLQSDNILFGETSDDPIVFPPPILSGFDFSRPDSSNETTIKSFSRAQDDYYRHPDLLNGQRSLKSHDIYALGIILIEIALWKPIEAIMHISLGKDLSRSQIPRIQERLLSGRYGEYVSVLNAVAAMTGSKYAEVAKRCIEGGEALGIEAGDDQDSAQVGGKLQGVFYDEVYRKLGSIEV